VDSEDANNIIVPEYGAPMLLRKSSFLVLLALPLAAYATPIDKYFGYFGGDYQSPQAPDPANSGFPEFKDHVNLYSILIWSADVSDAGKAGSEAYVLGELAKARAAHVHAIVPAFPFVFRTTFDPATHQQNACWTIEPNASQAWSSLAQKMVQQGYLIPGDPSHSTVVATYIVDEPNSGANCLSDVNGQANPAWVNAVNAIRQGPGTSSLPIASIMTDNFQDNMRQGIQLIDWVGFDHYGYSDANWQNAMNALKSVAPGKKYIVVPGAMQGCENVTVEGTTRYFNAIENDSSVTWIAPFAWFSAGGSCKGIRDIPSIRTTYTAEGLKIRNLQCSSSIGEKWFCGKGVNVSPAINYLLDD
jgi:hypothetical protein